MRAPANTQVNARLTHVVALGGSTGSTSHAIDRGTQATERAMNALAE
jgi:hypothetical protein